MRFLPRSIKYVRAGFTLVELLVVMLIITVIISLSGPLLRGVLSGRNISDGVDTISGYLAYARTQAITQNTCVVVGFYQESNSDDLQMAGVVSVNGTFDPASFQPPLKNVIGPSASYPVLGNVVHISNATLVPTSALGARLQAKLPAAETGSPTVECSASPNYPANASYFSFPIGGKSFSYCVIVFTPQGEALFFPKASGNVANFSANLPYYSQLFIGLRATRNGSVVESDTNSAAIALDGGSGAIKVYRL